MTAKRNAAKPAARSPSEAALDGGATAPAPKGLARLMARLKTLKGAIVAIAAVGAVLGGFAGYWNAYQAARGGSQSVSLLALVGTGNAGPLSIVVLPFANLTGDPQQAYVADGLTAAVTADLSRIRDAFIVSTTTAFAYKDKAVTAQEIGKQLGVRFALQGGVQRLGDKIRISAQLADTTSNAQLWSESFDGSQAELFFLQDLVTTRVGNSIGREMVVAAARESETRKNNQQTGDLMLRARALDLKPVSLKRFEEIQALYRQVLLLEPGNVHAMVGLARSLSVSASSDFIADPAAREKQRLEGRDLASRAKELDPGIADIYLTLSLYALDQDDYKEAIHAGETALSLDPRNPARHSSLAVCYTYAGEPARALELLAQGIRLDPRHLSAAFLVNVGRAHFMLGDDEAAIGWLLKGLDAHPNWEITQAYLAMAYARTGDHARSRLAVAALLRSNPKFRLSEFEAASPKSPAAYREFWQTRLWPAGLLAELPQ